MVQYLIVFFTYMSVQTGYNKDFLKHQKSLLKDRLVTQQCLLFGRVAGRCCWLAPPPPGDIIFSGLAYHLIETICYLLACVAQQCCVTPYVTVQSISNTAHCKVIRCSPPNKSKRAYDVLELSDPGKGSHSFFQSHF